MGALNIPSAADIERLTRRVRSVSQRLEGIEDGVDRLDARIAELSRNGLAERLERIEETLDGLARDLTALRATQPGAAEPVPSSQERLQVPRG
jgi:chromosome segregation ATPase